MEEIEQERKQKIEQLTIFLENKPGELLFLTQTLSLAEISIKSIQLADSTDFGLARVIVDDTLKAKEILEQKGLSVRITPVFGVHIEDEIGSFHKIVALLSEQNINILYCYSFYRGNGGIFIFSVTQNQLYAAIDLLLTNNIAVLKKEEL